MYRQIRVDPRDPVQIFFMTRYKRISYFSKLNLSLIEELAFYLQVRVYEVNQDIIEPNSVCDAVYMIMQGVANIYTKSEEEEIELDWLGKGSIIGQYSVFSDEEMIVGARAMTMGGTACLVLDRDTISSIMKRRNIIDSLVTKISENI